ncbi:MAG TPA: YceI family protein [Gemmatimonadales bacterium]|nr:YceI family protein [Gemmatimonadales bacterium]
MLQLASLPLLAALLVGAPAPGPVPPADTVKAARWRIDVTHSELRFRIRHLVSRVTGTFTDWEGTIVADPTDLAGGSVSVTIRTKSIDTNHERRDAHLRSADFFHADSAPTITFRSTRVEQEGERIRVVGELTIRGTTRPVVLEGRYLGVAKGPGGRDRIGFEASTRLNRLDYGVSWNRAAEGGGVVLGDEVDVDIVVAAVREDPEAAAAGGR